MEKIKLNIQLFASGTIEFNNWSTNTQLRGKIEWSSTPIENQNKSRVTADIYARRTSSTTTGKQWNGYVNIGDNNHSFSQIYTGVSTSVSTSWVLIQSYTDIIEHNADGTKSIIISGQISGPSGTSLAGKSSWDSATAVLDTLHKAPVLNYVGFTEENNTLLSMGVTDNQFVPYLSQKNISINLSLYDNAILGNINWRFKDLTLDNLELIPILSPSETPPQTTGTFTYTKLVNFANRDIAYTQVSSSYYSKVGYSIIDNMSGKYITPDSDLTQYEIIPYKKPILTANSTYVKRDGQTSGKVNLNVNGTFYNGLIGNTQNTISVYYKYWLKSSSEPSTYIQVPSASVSVSGNNVSVVNYPIGSTTETDPNYFDYDESYYVSVKIVDLANQEGTLNENLSIPKGISIWSEYLDHVDFLKLTIGGNNPFDLDNETIIGKYNGEPVYKKVFYYTSTINPSSSATIGTLSDNASKVFMLNGVAKLSSGAFLPLPATNPNSINEQIEMYLEDKKYIKVGTGSSRTISEAIVTIIYTKE